jgi:hypothetical protein
LAVAPAIANRSSRLRSAQLCRHRQPSLRARPALPLLSLSLTPFSPPPFPPVIDCSNPHLSSLHIHLARLHYPAHIAGASASAIMRPSSIKRSLGVELADQIQEVPTPIRSGTTCRRSQAILIVSDTDIFFHSSLAFSSSALAASAVSS